MGTYQFVYGISTLILHGIEAIREANRINAQADKEGRPISQEEWQQLYDRRQAAIDEWNAAFDALKRDQEQ